MKVYLYITIAALCFVEIVPTKGGGKSKTDGENEKTTVTPDLISYSVSKTEGDTTGKMKVTFPTKDGSHKELISNSGKVITNLSQIINKFAPTSLEALPFKSIAKWQQFYYMSVKDYGSSIRNNDDIALFDPESETFADLLGDIYSEFLPESLDDHDDGVLEEREFDILFKVKTYFKHSVVLYFRIPFAMNKVKYMIELCSVSDKQHFPGKVTAGHIIKDDIRKLLLVIVVCFINEKVLNKNHILKPTDEINNFMKENRIGDGYTEVDDAVAYLCKSYQDEINASFIIYIYNKSFIKNGAPRKVFEWYQTYQRDGRIQILDIHRLYFKIYDQTEPENYKTTYLNQYKTLETSSPNKEDSSTKAKSTEKSDSDSEDVPVASN